MQKNVRGHPGLRSASIGYCCRHQTRIRGSYITHPPVWNRSPSFMRHDNLLPNTFKQQSRNRAGGIGVRRWGGGFWRIQMSKSQTVVLVRHSLFTLLHFKVFFFEIFVFFYYSMTQHAHIFQFYKIYTGDTHNPRKGRFCPPLA